MSIINKLSRGGVAPYFSSCQTGRSMIEMLMVLAIIGVLTLVGIAGYSKAMENYKINKLKDQLTAIEFNVIEAFNVPSNYRQLGTDKTDATDLAKELGIFPEEMVRDDGSVVHAFGGEVHIRAVEYGGIEGGAFTVDIEGLPRGVAVKLGMDPSNESNAQLMYIDLN